MRSDFVAIATANVDVFFYVTKHVALLHYAAQNWYFMFMNYTLLWLCNKTTMEWIRVNSRPLRWHGRTETRHTSR